jgi:hypothetical protein
VVRSSVVHWKTQSQVEVTVKEGSVPAHAQLMTAHESLNRLGIKRLSEELEVIPLLVLPSELCSESSQRHIRDGKETGELYTETLAQFTSIALLKG